MTLYEALKKLNCQNVSSIDFARAIKANHNEVLNNIRTIINYLEEARGQFIISYYGMPEEPNIKYIITRKGINVLVDFMFVQPKSIE